MKFVISFFCLVLFSAAAAAQPVVFEGVAVIPMDGERVLEDHTVIIADGRIAALGPRSQTPAPDGARIISGAGKYLIPGLAEMHGHLPGGGAQAEDTLFLFLARGVTLVRGMLGNDGQFALRRRIEDGEIDGPRLYLAAPLISGGNVKTPGAARELVRRYSEEGWDLLKVHEGLSPAVYEAMAAEAAQQAIPFGGHVADAVGLEAALNAGQRTIDHLDNYLEFMGAENVAVTDAMLARAVAATREAGAGVVPTMALWEHISGLPVDILDFEELKYVAPTTVESWTQSLDNLRAEAAADPAATALMLENRRKLLKALSDGGAEILLGSDAPQLFSVPGFSVHREMAVMAEAGMTPYEILYSATAAAGAYFADKETLGVIAPGARADLVLLNANPLDDIAHAGDIAGIMANGRWLSSAEISARLDAIASRRAGN